MRARAQRYCAAQCSQDDLIDGSKAPQAIGCQRRAVNEDRIRSSIAVYVDSVGVVLRTDVREVRVDAWRAQDESLTEPAALWQRGKVHLAGIEMRCEACSRPGGVERDNIRKAGPVGTVRRYKRRPARQIACFEITIRQYRGRLRVLRADRDQNAYSEHHTAPSNTHSYLLLVNKQSLSTKSTTNYITVGPAGPVMPASRADSRKFRRIRDRRPSPPCGW